MACGNIQHTYLMLICEETSDEWRILNKHKSLGGAQVYFFLFFLAKVPSLTWWRDHGRASIQ